MIQPLLIIMGASLSISLMCLWIISWSRNALSNANLDLIAGIASSVFLVATGFLLPILGYRYRNIPFLDDNLHAIVFISTIFGLSLCIAGVGLMFRNVMDVIDDFKWAFNKNQHD